MFKKCLFFMLVGLLNGALFAQSAEEGSPFNRYMSADAGVNPLSGTVALSKNLASISAGDVQASFTMSYSGNITQAVNNRNDVAPTGWLGLGWSMGFAKIICEHNGSMSRVDDSYYLMTAEGNRYRIIEENKKWWIAGLPYWKIEPTIQTNVLYTSRAYEIIVGWTLTDDSGKHYYYGDFDAIDALRNGNVARNASQYVLCWPKTYGIVGQVDGGDAYPYPSVWNLQKMSDLKGNYIEFNYKQYGEYLKVNGWTSAFPYTKECYLSSVKSSEGDSIAFDLKPKGEGLFSNEFLDVTGKNELTVNDADAFIDPMERQYLSKIMIYGKDGSLINNVEFCYGSISLAPNGIKDSRYVKRMLLSVVFTNSQADVVDNEEYEYNMDANGDSPEKNIPLGMLKSVTGTNCGKVSFDYLYTKVKNADAEGLHSQEISMTKVSSIGYLDDGTPYIAGFENGYVAVYVRVFGRWVPSVNFKNDNNKDKLKEDKDGSFIIGDKGWFIYVKPKTEGADYTPVVWNGQAFKSQGTFTDKGSRDNIAVGSGFIFKAKLDGSTSHVQLSIPWSIWGKTYEDNAFEKAGCTYSEQILGNCSENDFPAEDGSSDRRAIKVFASANHVGIFYLGQNWGMNNGRLRLYTFDHHKDKLILTYYETDLDDDNVYSFSGNFLYAATEDRGLYGQNAEILQWFEPDASHSIAEWRSCKSWNLDGKQGVPSIEAVGGNYFVEKHADGDEMSVFYWDGEEWTTPYKNKNMVSGDNFDFFYESEWNGIAGNDFFIAREPLIEITHVKIPYWVPKRWGLRKRHKTIPVWSSTYRGALLDRFDIRDGVWSNTGAKNLHDSHHKTHVMVGTDWYVEKTSKLAFTWNGYRWVLGNLNIDYGDDYKSLGGNSFAIENKKAKKTKIYFKKSDSFTNEYGVYLVSKKTVIDPVLDKTVEYGYDYEWHDSAVDFDMLNNTPIIAKYTVILPNNIGKQTKVLCNYTTLNTDKLGLGAGQICEEETRNGAGFVTNYKKTSYDRYRDNGWPLFVYQDRITEVLTKADKIQTKETYEYSTTNGQISSIKTFLDNESTPLKEKRIVYAADEKSLYKDMLDANRLVEETRVLECKGTCGDKGENVVSASVSRYKKEAGYYVISDVWSYKKMDSTFSSVFSFDYKAPPISNANWTKNSNYTRYEFNKAIESENELGIKSAAIYEKMNNGLLLGSVLNAGYDEVFLLTGTPIDIKKENVEHSLTLNGSDYYEIIPLKCGNAVDQYNYSKLKIAKAQCGSAYIAGNDANYGRFSKNAVLVNASYTLKGKVKPNAAKNYVFSAWVQGVNASAKTYLYVDGKLETNWSLLGNGKWQQVEWDVSLSAGEHSFELKTDNNNDMRAQNVLFIPSEASATVTYWDKILNKPVVTVNDRGIGSYSVLDDNGRLIQTFGEDGVGDLVKLSETEYRLSDCRVNVSGEGRLSSLEINKNKVLGLKAGGTVSYVVPNSTDEIFVNWKTLQAGDKVSYAFVKQGESFDHHWVTACCNALNEASLSLAGSNNWLLAVNVSPFDNNYYTIEINKATSGWIDYGSPRNVGYLPKFSSENDPNYFYYLVSEGINANHYNGSNWEESSNSKSISRDYLQVDANGGKCYILASPKESHESWIVKPDANDVSTWYREFANMTAYSFEGYTSPSLKNNLGSKNEQTDFYRIAVDKNSNPYVLYQKSVKSNVAKDPSNPVSSYSEPTSLVVKTYDNTSNVWNVVGSSLDIDSVNSKFKIIPDVVTEGKVVDADIAIDDKNGYIYVAYIGTIPNMSTTVEDTVEILDSLGVPHDSMGTNVVSPNFVVIKRLYSEKSIDQSVNKKIWAGPSLIQDEVNSSLKTPNIYGDILEVSSSTEDEPITSARRIKLAKGENTMYLAVMYQLLPGDEDGSEIAKGKLALSVFKAESKTITSFDENGAAIVTDAYKFEPLADNSVISSIYSSNVDEEKRIIAYLDDSDPFDFTVFHDKNGDVPYVMFANASNNNMMTVVKYEGGRWLSVGKPAFADVQNEVNSADLAVNSVGAPFVVFKENALSGNRLRQNHIVPMRYSSTNDKDLTLTSLGNVSGTSISSNFRQYILNYSADVPENVEYIDIVPEPRKKLDVSGIVVENNGNVVAFWNLGSSSNSIYSVLPGIDAAFDVSSTSYMRIPIVPGDNNLSVKVYGVDADFLAYNIFVRRPIVSLAEITAYTDNGELRQLDLKNINPNDEEVKDLIPSSNSYGGGSSSSNSSSSSNVVGWSGEEITFVSTGDSENRHICFQFNAFWTMIYNNQYFYANSCIDMFFAKNQCSNGQNVQKILLLDRLGNVKLIRVVDGSCEKNKNNNVFVPYEESSSSSNPSGYGTSSSWSSSSYPPGYGTSSSWSSSSYPPGYGTSSSWSSSSYPPGYGTSSSWSSSSVPPGFGESSSSRNIPDEYAFMEDYKVFAAGNLIISDRVNFNGGKYACTNVNVGVNAKVNGTLFVSSYAELRNNSYTENLIVGGSVNTQNGAMIKNRTTQAVALPNITSKRFSVGSEDILVYNGSRTLNPGKYRQIHIFAGTTVYVNAGEYSCESFIVEPDAKVYFNNGDEPIRLWVQNNLSFGDRTQIISDENNENLFVYTNANYVYMGVLSSLHAIIVAPNATINMASGHALNGQVCAREINVQPDVIVK